MQTKQKSIGIARAQQGLHFGCLVSLYGLSRMVPVAAQVAPPPTPPGSSQTSDSKLALSQSPTPTAYARGIEAYKKGDLETARRLLGEAVIAEPENGEAQAILGYLLAQAGHYDEALPHLEKAVTVRTISISPTNARLNLGKVLLMLPSRTDADTQRAVTLFEQAAQMSPGVEDVQLTLGYGYARAQSFEKAAAAYRRATEIAPSDAAAWKNLGLTLRKTGPAAEAVIALKKATTLDGSDVESWINLSDAYMDLVEPSAALAALTSARKAGQDNVQVLIRTGNLNRRLNHPLEAADAYGAAAGRLEAGSPAPSGVSAATLYCDQGAALLKAGRAEDAEAAFSKALALNPAYPEALLNSGSIMYTQGRIAGALERFKKATEFEPRSELAWKDLGTAAQRNKDFDLAISSWKQVVHLDPADYGARDALVSLILAKNPKSDEAISHYIVMEHLRPNDPSASIGLGSLYERQADANPLASVTQSKLILALNAYTEAIRRKPGSAIAYNRLGVVHELRGEIPEAISAYRKAMALDPHFREAQANLARAARLSTRSSKHN